MLVKFLTISLLVLSCSGGKFLRFSHPMHESNSKHADTAEMNPTSSGSENDGSSDISSSFKAGTDSSSPCDKTYDTEFKIEDAGINYAMKAVAIKWDGTTSAIKLADDSCRALGREWSPASGSFGKDFGAHLRTYNNSTLDDALDECPLNAMYVDTVCAPCTADSVNCPCSERYIHDWQFCYKNN